MISFKQNFSPKSVKQFLADSVPKSRRNAPLQGYRILDAVHFLRAQMNTEAKTDTLFRQDSYVLQIHLSSYTPREINPRSIIKHSVKHHALFLTLANIDTLIYNSNPLDSRMNQAVKIIIPLLDILRHYLVTRHGNRSPLMKTLSNKLSKIGQSNYSSLEKANKILDLFIENIKNIPYLSSDDFMIRTFTEKYNAQAIHDIMVTLLNLNTISQSDFLFPLIYNITSDPSLDSCFEFLDDLNDLVSETSSFLSFKVPFLSDGEQANLAMYSSINEQISQSPEEKKHFILLFDEIER